MNAHAIHLKRAYDPPAAGDGRRVLVDGMWPRGVKKSEARLDEWRRDAAPSKALRQWFGHKPERFVEFRQRYKAELAEKPALLDHLRNLAREGPLTLVFSARDTAHNNAVVLKEVLEESN